MPEHPGPRAIGPGELALITLLAVLVIADPQADLASPLIGSHRLHLPVGEPACPETVLLVIFPRTLPFPGARGVVARPGALLLAQDILALGELLPVLVILDPVARLDAVGLEALLLLLAAYGPEGHGPRAIASLPGHHRLALAIRIPGGPGPLARPIHILAGALPRAGFVVVDPAPRVPIGIEAPLPGPLAGPVPALPVPRPTPVH